MQQLFESREKSSQNGNNFEKNRILRAGVEKVLVLYAVFINILIVMEMKALKIWRIALTLLVAFSIVSCDKELPDGRWSPMKWVLEEPTQSDANNYSISATGGEFVFFCKNYSSPWLSNAMSNGVYFYPYDNAHRMITTDWFKAEIDGNVLKVVFEANDTAEQRPLQLTVTAGDVFHGFTFKQLAE